MATSDSSANTNMNARTNPKGSLSSPTSFSSFSNICTFDETECKMAEVETVLDHAGATSGKKASQANHDEEEDRLKHSGRRLPQLQSYHPPLKKLKIVQGGTEVARTMGYNGRLPMKPLTAYNIFFRDERARVVALREQELPMHLHGSNEDSTAGEKLQADSRDQFKLDDDADRTKLTAGQARLAEVKKATQPIKSKMLPLPFFQRLAKHIGYRWKQLSGAERAKYQELAKADKNRYHQEMKMYHDDLMRDTREKAAARVAKLLRQEIKGEIVNAVPPSDPSTIDQETPYTSILFASSDENHREMICSGLFDTPDREECSNGKDDDRTAREVAPKGERSFARKNSTQTSQHGSNPLQNLCRTESCSSRHLRSNDMCLTFTQDAAFVPQSDIRARDNDIFRNTRSRSKAFTPVDFQKELELVTTFTTATHEAGRRMLDKYVHMAPTPNSLHVCEKLSDSDQRIFDPVRFRRHQHFLLGARASQQLYMNLMVNNHLQGLQDILGNDVSKVLNFQPCGSIQMPNQKRDPYCSNHAGKNELGCLAPDSSTTGANTPHLFGQNTDCAQIDRDLISSAKCQDDHSRRLLNTNQYQGLKMNTHRSTDPINEAGRNVMMDWLFGKSSNPNALYSANRLPLFDASNPLPGAAAVAADIHFSSTRGVFDVQGTDGVNRNYRDLFFENHARLLVQDRSNDMKCHAAPFSNGFCTLEGGRRAAAPGIQMRSVLPDHAHISAHNIEELLRRSNENCAKRQLEMALKYVHQLQQELHGPKK